MSKTARACETKLVSAYRVLEYEVSSSRVFIGRDRTTCNRFCCEHRSARKLEYLIMLVASRITLALLFSTSPGICQVDSSDFIISSIDSQSTSSEDWEFTAWVTWVRIPFKFEFRVDRVDGFVDWEVSKAICIIDESTITASKKLINIFIAKFIDVLWMR